MKGRFRVAFSLPHRRATAAAIRLPHQPADRQHRQGLLPPAVRRPGLDRPGRRAARHRDPGPARHRRRVLRHARRASFYWGVTTVMGSGDASYVTSPGGYVISWLLVLFGVAIVASITGALVGFVIDFILKEGQGMGAAGYRDHIVVCGWNSTARDLVAELEGDDYEHKIVVIHDADKNPAGTDVYFVSGDVTNEDDLRRAGIDEAMAAVVCPADGSNEADMRSILTVMAIESIAPQVRTVVEVNNPQHVDHFRRANADEIMVTSRIASRLLARSSLYPGPRRDRHRHRLRRRGLRALPRRAARGVRRPHRRRALRAAALGPHGHPAGDRPRRSHLRQPRHRLPAGARRRRGRRRGVARHAGAPRGRDPGLSRPASGVSCDASQRSGAAGGWRSSRPPAERADAAARPARLRGRRR